MWRYIEEHVQRTGVAIETQGFSFVTSGRFGTACFTVGQYRHLFWRRRESLTGNATLHLYPHFKPLQAMPGIARKNPLKLVNFLVSGVVDYLSTEISTSKQKKFPLVTFVDSPGLVDGDMWGYSKNPGTHVHFFPQVLPIRCEWGYLVVGRTHRHGLRLLRPHWPGLLLMVKVHFTFFVWQALCKRTLNIVEKISEKHAERMRFYLSKADEAGHESDRQRVMMQIVQVLYTVFFL